MSPLLLIWVRKRRRSPRLMILVVMIIVRISWLGRRLLMAILLTVIRRSRKVIVRNTRVSLKYRCPIAPQYKRFVVPGSTLTWWAPRRTKRGCPLHPPWEVVFPRPTLAPYWVLVYGFVRGRFIWVDVGLLGVGVGW